MGEFTDPNGRKGVVEQLRGLNSRAWAAIGCGIIVLLLIVAALSGTKMPGGTSAAASRSLPMTPSGSYTVGEQNYVGTVAMPDYRGWTITAAISDLASRGINVGTAVPGSEYAIVQSQNPYPGTRISQANASIVQLMVPTTTTTTTPPPATTSAAPSNTDVDVDVDHHNLPDGALTGGYCRHKWWC